MTGNGYVISSHNITYAVLFRATINVGLCYQKRSHGKNEILVIKSTDPYVQYNIFCQYFINFPYTDQPMNKYKASPLQIQR